jgi:hypothetical protein
MLNVPNNPFILSIVILSVIMMDYAACRGPQNINTLKNDTQHNDNQCNKKYQSQNNNTKYIDTQNNDNQCNNKKTILIITTLSKLILIITILDTEFCQA